MRTLVWLTEGTWPACVDAARDVAATDEITLLHVIDSATVQAAAGAHSGLLGRTDPAAARRIADAMAQAQADLFAAATERLGRAPDTRSRQGRLEREVVAECAHADLLICARDGDHQRLGPRSLGHATRFVVDHAPCRVLLIWPDEPPSLTTLPPVPEDR
jgi:nucleotide-binding universal stress UspA family protein